MAKPALGLCDSALALVRRNTAGVKDVVLNNMKVAPVSGFDIGNLRIRALPEPTITIPARSASTR